MVKIRLRRVGKKKRAFYRIIVTDSRNPRDGKFIEQVGLYHPLELEEKQLIAFRYSGFWRTVNTEYDLEIMEKEIDKLRK